MTRFDNSDDSVVVVIGSGAGGGTLANDLCQAGVRVVCLEAGPHLTGPDYHNDEWPAFQQMAWTDMRTTSGSWRVARDFPNLPAWTVKAVGGTSTHWAGACPRFKDYEFATKGSYGAVDGASLLDWPITLADLEPYYDNAEIRMGVTHRHGRPPLPANNNYKVLANGAAKVGYRQYATGPYATNATPYDGRPATNQDGFNFQGDKTGAKWSTLVAELPKAELTGNLDLRPNCHAAQITHDASGKADGVLYFEGGVLHRQAARVVCVAANAIESARLLLLSGSPQFPDGLANSSGEVGKNYMRHLTASSYARFEQPVHMYRGETMAGIVADETGLDTARGFVGGYNMETLSLGPAFGTYAGGMLMAQVGSFVPATRARIGTVDKMFSRIGASDDLVAGRSTFMVEMLETAAILTQATGRSLVILDEVGRGTSTHDGLSVAQACMEHLHDVVGCRTLFATHYHELADVADALQRATCMAMDASTGRHGDVFTYRIGPGRAGQSHGLRVAALAGMPVPVLDRAATLLASYMEDNAGDP